LILCCGEALVDMVPNGVGQNLVYHPKLGGSVFNTARALGRLGAEVGFLSGVSNDPFGEQLIKSMHESGVDSSMIVRGNGLTTLAFVHLDSGDATYRFYDENSAGRMIYTQDFPTISPDVQAMFFGGISLCLDPAASTYHDIFDANTLSKLTMIDPNVRPDIAPDTTAYFERLKQMIALSDIVKVSQDDLDLLIDGDHSTMEKLAMIKSEGPSVAILTEGSKGVRALYSDCKEVRVNAPKVRVRDTIGAGDTFNAGFLAMLENLNLLSKAGIKDISAPNLQNALEYGVKAAAVVVQREGANSPWAREMI